MTAVLGPCFERFCTVYIDSALLAPVNPDLLTRVRMLLRRGERVLYSTCRVSHSSTPAALANWSAHTTSRAP